MGAGGRRGLTVLHPRCKPLRDVRGEGSGSGGVLRLSLPGVAEGLVLVSSAMVSCGLFLNSSVAQYEFLCKKDLWRLIKDQPRLKVVMCTSDREYQRIREAPPMDTIE